MSKIALRKITSENWREALALSVHIDQQKFVADATPPVAIALAKAYIRPGGKTVIPYGIYNEDKMVGFFNLHYTPNSKEDYWLFHFFIDMRHQREGLGTEAIKALIHLIQKSHTSCKRLWLTVHPENKAGKRFYKRLGFKDENFPTYGEPTYSISI